MPARARAIVATQRWVDRMIIGHNLCPYTAAVKKRPGALRTSASMATTADELMEEILDEAELLSTGPAETSLLVIAPSSEWAQQLHASFPTFMSLGWQIDDLLQDRSSNGSSPTELQLALFHPLAVRSLYASGEAEAEDFAMRAPHPTVHLLRVSDVQAVARSAAQVPARNRDYLRAMDLDALTAEFQGLVAEGNGSS
mmetsp:Transcript_1800/g.5119  ORF Transcript_1800/g.5119 Transcript_1800/m.5119 type:complete len:198 (-) Transcript_1800:215-808(-)|eukprot:CAMPEP_0115844626 /NCGR_PEP_ID=MMETSP0287-20121206/8925_1 /TAXON_ID=412157 /ORGANISM="Chrysochromulina rotalis, Strain UIO044" /LENGTH=197 /DNA_ID=CAMNT_0003298357 /DNA_START=31 /DNA_END=624 /DNA_ORIENTATION=+